MPQITRTALVPFSAQQMFTLVNDVTAYPDFLPGCSGTQILEQSSEHMMASVDEIGRASCRERVCQYV